MDEHATPPYDEERLGRWLEQGRIRVYPRRPADRLALLTYVVERLLDDEERLAEPALNERMQRFTDDPATLRRYLVDHRLLARSDDGSDYRRAARTAA